jgi:putative glycosyltransferase (TIGR04372 family)
LDLAVQVSSKGYFGADSGPCWASLVLNKPVSFVNMIPFNQPCPIDPKKLVVIFKPLYSISEKRLLSMSEMVTPFISNLRSTSDYVRANIEPLENSMEDIHACLEDFTSLIKDSSNTEYDFEKMTWIRDKLEIRTLPSVSTRYLNIHPEIRV